MNRMIRTLHNSRRKAPNRLKLMIYINFQREFIMMARFLPHLLNSAHLQAMQADSDPL